MEVNPLPFLAADSWAPTEVVLHHILCCRCCGRGVLPRPFFVCRFLNSCTSDDANSPSLVPVY